MKEYYLGIDLGGTQIKGGVVDSELNILLTEIVNTQCELGNETVLQNIIKLINTLIDKAKLSFGITEFAGLGLGTPGIIDSKNGVIICAHNLHFSNYNIAKKLQKATNMQIKIINDANAAILAEYNKGAGKGHNNIVMLTLGTGVGGGAIIDGNLLLGNCSAGAEFGHSVIVYNGKKCSCGRLGCLEQYVSASALKKATIEAIKNNENSKMAKLQENEITAKTSFDFMKNDVVAKQVVNDFINYLSTVVINLSNVFRPEVVILGGGVAAQGYELIKPLQELVNKNIYASDITPKVEVVTAKLGNSAGILGAVINYIQTSK